jgi:hypothetical protein
MPLTDDHHDRDPRPRAARRREVNTLVHWRPGPASAWTVAPGDIIPPVEPGPGPRGPQD